MYFFFDPCDAATTVKTGRLLLTRVASIVGTFKRIVVVYVQSVTVFIV